MRKIYFVFLFMLTLSQLHAQYLLKGTVYDSTIKSPVLGVMVETTSNKKTFTNGEGHYEIEINNQDSVWFTYLNKATHKYSVADIPDLYKFNISLKINIPVLQEVKVWPRSYRLDSMENRREYEKFFNYEPVNLGSLVTPSGGISIEEIIRGFQFRKNKRMLAIQKMVLQDEKEKFVDRRFNKRLVRLITGLNSPDIENFMLAYRPSVLMASTLSDYDFNIYIKQSGEKYKLENGLK